MILGTCLGLAALLLGGCAFSAALQRYLNPAEPLHKYAQTAGMETLPDLIQVTPLPSTPTAIPCQETQGNVERFSFPSAQLEEDLTFSIYTPPCYDDSASDPYPVLYLLHGQSQDDRIWFDEFGAAQISDAAIQSGRKPFVIVAPYEVDNYAPVVDSKFGAAVIDDLIPYIEANFNVCTSRECRSIGGISHGAGWAVHLAVLNIDMFGSVGAHSVGFFAGDSYRFDRLRQTMSPEEFPRFYVDRGEKDYLSAEIDALNRTLTRNGIPHSYIVQAGSHSAAYWADHFAEYIQWYLDGWDSSS